MVSPIAHFNSISPSVNDCSLSKSDKLDWLTDDRRGLLQILRDQLTLFVYYIDQQGKFLQLFLQLPTAS